MQAGGGEFVAKNLKPSPCARFQATSVEILLKWVAVSIQQPVTQGGVGFGVSWYVEEVVTLTWCHTFLTSLRPPYSHPISFLALTLPETQVVAQRPRICC